MKIDPSQIYTGIPVKEHPSALHTSSLLTLYRSGRLTREPNILFGSSNVAAVRMMLAHQFMQSECEWFFGIDDDIAFRPDDFDLLWEQHGDEQAVCADYLKKLSHNNVMLKEPVNFGLGFYRVHRTVLEAMAAKRTEDGRPWHPEVMYCGELMVDYFPQGPDIAGAYRQEDHGFWTCARMVDAKIRVERRTTLVHSGIAHWIYRAEDLPPQPELE